MCSSFFHVHGVLAAVVGVGVVDVDVDGFRSGDLEGWNAHAPSRDLYGVQI